MIFDLADKILNRPKEVDNPIIEINRLLDFKEPEDELLKTLSIFIKTFPVLAIFIIPIAFQDEYKEKLPIVYAAILSLPKVKELLRKTVEKLSDVKGYGRKGARDAIGLIAFSIIQAMGKLSKEVIYGRVEEDDVVDLLDVAKKAAEIYGDKHLSIDVDYSRAVFFFLVKRYEESAKIFEEISNKIESIKEKEKISKLVKLGLAQSYYYLGRYEDSIEILDSIISSFSKEDKRTELIFALYFKGKVLIALGRKDEGISLIKEAMKVAKDFDIMAYRLMEDELEKILKGKE